MMFFVISVIVITAFILIVVTIVTKPEESDDNHAEEPAEFVEAFGIAGINRNGCTMQHVGTFMGAVVADPDNEFDANAIKVVHQDGTLLGYIKAKETVKVRKLIGEDFNVYPCMGYIKFVNEHIDDYEKTGGQSGNDDIHEGFFVGTLFITNKF